ncbi:MAG: DNA mismatch repair endonuclease MutL, partial [Anaerolineae bacterium]|nr:DNA mismatch repair endonuclease MutL [Candidatus Roseilinea sp.]MDW8449171.1 DNA mismatch repair endonuclease MutL [Anaerolineae bacterium]
APQEAQRASCDSGMPIHILPDALVARIAAGEVVERPASVVKELVENAIDAGATDIRVECAEGGKRLIRVTDNGSGIPAAEVALAFEHHATSKLASADDLAEIHTLGFRGEALASIAAVSQVTCITRHAGEASGTLLRFDGGRLITQERIGRAPGTTMTVEHLFARVPARLKFLKSTQTERGHIDGVVTRYALAYPHIRFTLVHDGRVSFQSLGTGNLRDVLVEVYGADAAAQMIEVGEIGDWRSEMRVISNLQSPVSVHGYAALPTLDHANRSKITLFVNGRPVQDAKLSHAVVQAYHTLLMTGRYPVAVIMVRLPPAEVDVNVHPAKAEVRFRDADAVFSAVQRAVRRALLDNMTPPEPPAMLSGWPSDRQEPSAPAPAAGDQTVGIPEPMAQPPLTGSEAWARVGIARQAGALDSRTSPAPPTAQPPSHAQPTTRNLPALRILGQLAESYILAEGPEGLYLIDQHAAHERVLWERLLAQHELGALPSQHLLDPVPVTIPAESASLLEGQLDMLRDLGFEIEPFGGNTFLVRAVPSLMIQDDIAAALREIVADLEMGDAVLRKDLGARVLRRVCKRMAIKAGRVLSFAEMQALVRDLEACESPRTCPHGRPTMIYVGLKQIEKEFGRLG